MHMILEEDLVLESFTTFPDKFEPVSCKHDQHVGLQAIRQRRLGALQAPYRSIHHSEQL